MGGCRVPEQDDRKADPEVKRPSDAPGCRVGVVGETRLFGPGLVPILADQLLFRVVVVGEAQLVGPGHVLSLAVRKLLVFRENLGTRADVIVQPGGLRNPNNRTYKGR